MDNTPTLEAGSPRPDRLIGHVIEDRYKILEVIGRGGMGTVYRATQLSMERDVAVKVLKEALVKSQSATGRFVREAKVASLLKHPNAIVTYDFGASEAGLFLVMELLHGETLADRLLRVGALEPEEASRIAACVAAALAEAHEHGVVHRDLKPSNIFLHRVRDMEVVKVLDFGIAKFVHQELSDDPDAEERAAAVTAAMLYQTTIIEGPNRTAIGTAHYIAPEQILGGGLDGRADIYALGGLLYTMLHGYPPYRGQADDVLKMHVDAPVPVLDQDIPEELRVLTTVMLNKKPDRRPRTADEVALALRRFSGDTAGVGMARAPDDPTLPPPKRNRRRSQMDAAPVGEAALEIDLGSEERDVPKHAEPDGESHETRAVKPHTSGGLSTRVEATNGAVKARGRPASRFRPTPPPSGRRVPVAALAVAVVLIIAAVFAFAFGAKDQSDSVPDAGPPPPGGATPNVANVGYASNPSDWVRVSADVTQIGTEHAVVGGHDGERPRHEVQLTHSMRVKQTEVTRGQWQQVMGTTPTGSVDCGDLCPVTNINWWETLAFCNALSRGEGRDECYVLSDCKGEAGEGLECASVEWTGGPACPGYRLPTEAEWEFVARAVTLGAYGQGPRPHRRTLQPVATGTPNVWGIHDATSNVSEWVWDIYSARYYDESPRVDPTGPPTGQRRARRGCAYRDQANACRPEARFSSMPFERSHTIGFRVVLNAQ